MEVDAIMVCEEDRDSGLWTFTGDCNLATGGDYEVDNQHDIILNTNNVLLLQQPEHDIT